MGAHQRSLREHWYYVSSELCKTRKEVEDLFDGSSSPRTETSFSRSIYQRCNPKLLSEGGPPGGQDAVVLQHTTENASGCPSECNHFCVCLCTREKELHTYRHLRAPRKKHTQKPSRSVRDVCNRSALTTAHVNIFWILEEPSRRVEAPEYTHMVPLTFCHQTADAKSIDTERNMCTSSVGSVRNKWPHLRAGHQ